MDNPTLPPGGWRYRLVVWTLAGVLGGSALGTDGLLGIPAQAAPERLQPPSSPTVRTITGELTPASRRLQDGTYAEGHPFTGRAGQGVLIDLVSDAFDAYLLLVGPDGQVVAENDDGGDGVNARLLVTLPTTGTYEIWVNTYGPQEVGAYTLTWQILTSEAIAQRGGEQQADRLAQAAAALIDQGRYQEAEPLLLDALALQQQTFGDRALETTRPLNQLGLLYRIQARYREAVDRYQQARTIVAAELGDRHPAFAAISNNLGVVYDAQGRYDEAESLYLEALEIWQATLGADHPNVAQVLSNLGLLYYNQGRYDEAEARLLASIAIRRGDRDNPIGLGQSLNNLALLYGQQNRLAEAEALYLESLEIWTAQGGERHPDRGTVLNNLAGVYQRQGRPDEAIDLYQQALVIYRDLWGDAHPDVANTLNNLAVLHLEQGRYGEAEALFQDSLRLWRSQLGDHHPNIDINLSNLALLAARQGDLSQTLDYLQAALVVQEWNLNLNLAALADDQRQAYANTLTGTTDWVLSLNLNQAPQNPRAQALALTTLLRRKGRLLDAGVNNLQALRRNLAPADQDLLGQLTRTRQALATLTFNRPSHLSWEAYQQELAQLEAAANRLEGDLARRSSAFRAVAEPVELAAVQARLPVDGVLVEYVRYYPYDPAAGTYLDPYYAAYLLFPDGRIMAVNLGPASAIEAAIDAFTVALRQVNGDPTIAARALAQWVLDPLLPSLQGSAHVLISPDSHLNRVPFEALQTEAGRYWLEDHQISYLNSGRDLLKVNLNPASRAPAVIVANPDYGQAAAVAPAAPWAAERQIGGPASPLEGLQFGPLPGTALEAAAIAPLLPNAQVLTDANATENALKAVQAPRILHIATHGFFLSQDAPSAPPTGRGGIGVVTAPSTLSPQGRAVTIENPLLRAGLALAGVNTRASGGDDGVLTALEAASLNLLGTQLVVLSACETGLGDIANGEGVYGLRRAFTLAGAEAQLISLWQVDDYGTQSLMTQYYQALLQGQGRAAALRQVQLTLLRSQSPYAHPYYWAAFILTGNWQPLD